MMIVVNWSFGGARLILVPKGSMVKLFLKM